MAISVRRLECVYQIRWWLMVPPMVFMTFCTWHQVDHKLVAFALGGGIFMVGLSLRVWLRAKTRLHLGMGKGDSAANLFAYVRNPKLTSGTLMFVGLCFQSRLWWFTPIMASYCVIIYSSEIRYEASRIIERPPTLWQFFLYSFFMWLPKYCSEEGYLCSSILAELPCLLLPVPFVIKALLFA